VGFNDEAYQFRRSDLEHIRHASGIRATEHHRELDSTNSRALEWAGDPSLELPALVLTDLQTRGRGRGGNAWWAAPGALTCSLILSRPEHAPSPGPCLSLTAGLAVCEALHQLCPGLSIGLKWPNDVYVQSRKICGILVEAPLKPRTRVVVGIGVNVNNSLDQAPAAIRSRATSLVDVAGYPFSLTVVLVEVVRHFTRQYESLARGDAQLQRRWQSLCMLIHNRIRVDAGSTTTEGICRGIDADGALVIETTRGRRSCVTGVVSVLEEAGRARGDAIAPQ
jgi:BirA family transcriptional regulator, biotin operon repressor / biotin---[acetyl-CoA-carboxylase] ligase